MIPSRKAVLPSGKTPWRAASASRAIALRRRGFIKRPPRPASVQRLFALSPTGMLVVRLRDGRILDANRALLDLLACTREQLAQAGPSVIALGSWLEDDSVQRALMQSTGVIGPVERELLALDGTRVSALITGACIEDPNDGQVIWATVQDLGQRRARERELVSAARSDPLTGLANRLVLRERLEASLRALRLDPARRFAVLFIDFDRFKQVNDTLGHQAGDQMLREIAERLRRNLRASDFDPNSNTGSLVARLGGDEFVLLARVNGEGAAQSLARRLLAALAPPFQLGGREVQAAASIGIVLADQGSASAEHLLRDADVAMYEAKRAGGSCSVVFDGPMRRRGERRLMLQTSLVHAMNSGQISLAYQPVIDLSSGAIVAVEALARWRHPRLGDVSPGEFIPIAEESGLMLSLGDWVIREASRQFMQWRSQLGTQAPARVSVNLSRVQLEAAGALRDRVTAVMAETGIPPACLQFEVSEREARLDAGSWRAALDGLRAAGVGLALDDFGTGATSMGHLRELPFDQVKMDHSFLAAMETDPGVSGMVRGTLSMFSSLGRVCVAEGVESASQAEMLLALGCRYAQGYHLGRPMAAEPLFGRIAQLSPV